MTLIRKTLLLLILSAASGLNGLAQSSDLVGTWTVDLDKTLDNVGQSNKMRYDSLPENAKANLKATFSKRTFTFYTSGRVMISYKVKGATREVLGEYTYNVAKQELSISAEKIARDYVLAWESEGRIKMSLKTPVDKAVLQSLCLKRTNDDDHE